MPEKSQLLAKENVSIVLYIPENSLVFLENFWKASTLWVFPVLRLQANFVLFQRPNLKGSPICLIMAALAVFESLVLILDFINNWFKLQLNIHLLGYKVSFFNLLHVCNVSNSDYSYTFSIDIYEYS